MNSRSNRREPIHKTFGDIIGNPHQVQQRYQQAIPPTPQSMDTTQTPQTPYIQSLRNTNAIQQRIPVQSETYVPVQTPSNYKSSSGKEEVCIHINSKKELNELLMGTYLVLDVWAEWCGPCKRIAPEFESYAKEYKNKGVTFAKVLVEDLMEWTNITVNSVPTFMFFHNGEKVNEQAGFDKENGIWKGVKIINGMMSKR